MGEIKYNIDNNYFIKVVNNLSEFPKLRLIWDNVLADHKQYTPFLCFDWYRIWIEHFQKNAKLLILIFYRGESVLAILPMMVKLSSFKGIMNVRKISLIGNVHSPIRDIIFNNIDYIHKKNVIENLLRFFENSFKKWDVIDFNTIPEENTILDILLSTCLSFGLKRNKYFCCNNWFLNKIDYTYEEYVKKLPKNLRRNIKRYKKRLKDKGSLRFEMITNGYKFDHYLGLYDQLRDKSWKAQEVNKKFQEQFIELAARNEWIRLSFLYHNDIPIAAGKYFVYQNSAIGIDSIYDLKYKKYSAGTVLTSEIFRYLIDIDKVSEIDLSRGDQPYKKEWAPFVRRRNGLMIFNKTVKGRLSEILVNKMAPLFDTNSLLKKTKHIILKVLEKA